MEIFNRACAASLFLFVLMPTTVAFADDDLETITVTATRAPSPDNPYYTVTIPISGINQGPGYTEAMRTKAKYEAFGKCMNDLHKNKAACDTDANDNLLANQAQCSQVARDMVGVTAGLGALAALTGVGAIPGGILMGASATSGTVLYNYCSNTAQNIFNNAKIACDLSFNQNKLKCDAIKP